MLVQILEDRSNPPAGFEHLLDGASLEDLAPRNTVHSQIALVPQLQAVVGIEHAESLANIVESCIELHVAEGDPVLGSPVEHCADQAANHQCCRHGCNRQGQGDRRQQRSGGLRRRLRNEADRAHGDEMMRCDRKREEDSGGGGCWVGFAPCRDKEGGRAKAGAEQDGGDHEIRHPDDFGRDSKRGHPHVVHGGNTDADHRATHDGLPAAVAEQGGRETGGRHDRCDHERHCGGGHVVADRKAWRVGEHGDEVRGPDAAAGHRAGGPQPDQAGSASASAGALKQVDGRQARQQTDAGCQQNQPAVVLGLKAIQNPQHALPRSCSP